jgi:hypothetical protein
VANFLLLEIAFDSLIPLVNFRLCDSTGLISKITSFLSVGLEPRALHLDELEEVRILNPEDLQLLCLAVVR